MPRSRPEHESRATGTIRWSTRPTGRGTEHEILIHFENHRGGHALPIALASGVHPIYISGDPTGEPYESLAEAAKAIATRYAEEHGLVVAGAYEPPTNDRPMKRSR